MEFDSSSGHHDFTSHAYFLPFSRHFPVRKPREYLSFHFSLRQERHTEGITGYFSFLTGILCGITGDILVRRLFFNHLYIQILPKETHI